MKKQRVLIFSSVFLLLCMALVAFVYKSSDENTTVQITATENGPELIRWYSPKKGSSKAKVTLVEFLDPACGTCRQFHPFVKKLLASHPEKLRLVVRHAPFHQGSEDMVKILLAAKLQGKYWETLEIMLQTQDNWTTNHKAQPEKIWKYLADIDLDIDKLRTDMETPRIAKRVEQDITDTIGLGVKKTPGFFVNGKPLNRFGYQELQDLVETEIRTNYQ